MANITCDGSGQIPVQSIIDGINNSVEKTGDTMTGHLEVPAGGTGAQVMQAQEIHALLSGISFAKNIIINAEVTRINQRGFDGTSWVAGEYGYDRWKGSTSPGMMLQPIEDGFYIPNTAYRLNYEVNNTPVETVDLTSPLSGVWEIEVPTSARKIHLVPAGTSEMYFKEDYGIDLLRCKRYYNKTVNEAVMWSGYTVSGNGYWSIYHFPIRMRDIPTVTLTNDPASFTLSVSSITNEHVVVNGVAKSNGNSQEYWTGFVLDAEI